MSGYYGNPAARSVDGFAIGELRWPVLVGPRVAMPDAGVSVQEHIQRMHASMAAIAPIGDMIYLQGVGVDVPITHRIKIRWMPNVDSTWVVLRFLGRPDGSMPREIFRIWKLSDDEGRFRFLNLSCELERSRDQPS